MQRRSDHMFDFELGFPIEKSGVGFPKSPPEMVAIAAVRDQLYRHAFSSQSIADVQYYTIRQAC